MGEKEYLGDGVYIEIKDEMIILTTENGISITNTIVLEPEVYFNMKFYIERYIERIKK